MDENVKISELPVASTIASPDVVPIVQGGVTKQADVSLFGGSFLSTNIARVDPSGSDSVGTVGDSTKPFLTVQAVINAIAVLAAGNDPPDAVVIDIGVNNFSESLTLDNSTGTWPIIIFKGITNNGNPDLNATQSLAFSVLSITGDGNQLDIRAKDCAIGAIFTDSPLVVVYDNGNSNGNAIVSTCSIGGGLTIGSMYGGGNGLCGSITANDTDILLFGVTADAPNGKTVATANGSVTIANCGQSPEGTTFGNYTQSLFSINAPNGAVTVNDSLLKDVTCQTAHLIRSKIYGTLTVSDPTQPVTDDQGPYAYNYDFARDAGAQGSIALTPSSGSQGTNLPSGFVVTGAILEIITPPDSSAHLATIALTSGESAGDLKTAAVVSGAPWSTTGLKSLTALLKTTASRAPAMVIAVQDLTAGKFTLHVQGYLNP